MSQRWAAEAGPHQVRTVDEALALAAHLRDPARTRPVVVISVHPRAAAPFIDAEDVADEVRGLVPVVVLSAHAASGFAEGLADPALSVRYGAGRLYPVGDRWLRNRNAAPLFLCSEAAQGPGAALRLVAAALTDAQRAGLLASPADLLQRHPPATVTVHGFSTDHHVLVRTEQGERGVLQTARLRVDVPAERLLRRGQRLTGALVGPGPVPQFLPALPDIDVPAQVRRSYPDGACVPALVREVAEDGAVLLLHPDFPVTLRDEGTVLTELLAPGDVVAVEVAWIDDGCSVALAEERRAFDALAILPGGPPWLVLAEPERINYRPAPEQPALQPGPVDDAEALRQLAEAEAAVALYAEQAAALQARVDELQRECRARRTDLREARLADRNRELPEVFGDAEQQFRWEVATTYLTHVPEAERAQHPLADYSLGKAFLGRLDTLPEIPRHAILQLVVDVLCERAQDQAWRAVQPCPDQRTGRQEERSDGGTAWLASLQEHRRSARRLKYWRLPDGSIELDRIAGHGDGAP
jgi:hypothetical protein